MVEIYRALRAFLLADATVAAAVSTRIYPSVLPQGALTPAITITKISGIRANILHGPASLANPRYQIDCWVRETSGTTAYTAALDLGSAVRSRLEGYSGLMTDSATSPASQYKVGVTFSDEREEFDTDVTGGYRRHSADYFIGHGVHPVTA